MAQDTIDEIDDLIDTFTIPAAIRAQIEKAQSAMSVPNCVDGIVFQFNKDSFAVQCEPIQQIPFLYQGQVPAVDMRTETECEVPFLINHPKGWARFSGAITEVHPPPTEAELAEMDPPFECHCGDADCVIPQATEETMTRCFGAVHGQRVTAWCVLNFDFYHHYPEDIIDPNQVYEITYRADTNKQFIWNVIEAKRVEGVDRDKFVDEKVWRKDINCGCCFSKDGMDHSECEHSPIPNPEEKENFLNVA